MKFKVLTVRETRLEDTLEQWIGQGWQLVTLCHSGRDSDGFDRFTLVLSLDPLPGDARQAAEELRQ